MPSSSFTPTTSLILALLVVVLAVLPQGSEAVNLYVSTTGNDANLCTTLSRCRSLGRALGLAVSGDTILVAAGTYSSLTDFSLTVSGLTLTLASESGNQDVVVDVDLRGRFLTATSSASVTVRGFTVRDSGGNSVGYGGTYFVQDSTLALETSSYSGCRAVDQPGIFGSGGCLYVTSSSLTVDSVDFDANFASGFGGVLFAESSIVSLTEVSMTSNLAASQGGAISCIDCALTYVGGQVVDNVGRTGAALYVDVDSSVDLTTVVVGSNSGADGGGLYLEGSGSLTDCVFEHNFASTGAAVRMGTSATFSATDSRFSFNTGVSGGALYLQGGATTVTDSNFNDNSAVLGGTVYVGPYESTMDFDGCSFENSTSSQSGGVFYSFIPQTSPVPPGPISVTNTVAAANRAQLSGGFGYVSGLSSLLVSGDFTTQRGELGGVFAAAGVSSVTITGGSFYENSAISGVLIWMSTSARLVMTSVSVSSGVASTYGGAVFSFGSCEVTISDCDFEGNLASYGGGALFFDIETVATIEASSFTSNSAPEGEGGAILCRQNSVLTFTDSSIDDSFALKGGALYGSDAASITVTDSTLTGNSVSGNGGGLGVEGSAVANLTGVVFEECGGENGGAVSVDQGASVAVSGSTFHNQSIPFAGAAVYCGADTASVQLTSSAFTFNTAGNGAAVHVLLCEATLVSCSFTDNSAGDGGGAINIPTSADVLDSTFARNTANFGGAILYSSDETAALREGPPLNGSTFENNLAKGGGGAVFFYNYRPPHDPWFFDCTFGDESDGTANVALGFGSTVGTLASRLVLRFAPTAVSANERFDMLVDVSDYFGTVVTFAEGEIEIPMQIEVTTTNSTIVGNRIVSVVYGLATFGQVLLRAEIEGAYDIFFSSLPYSDPIATVIQLNGCDPGFERISNTDEAGDVFFSCSECEAGYFQLDSVSPCKPCPVGARCEGGDRILADKDYWRALDSGLTDPVFYRCARWQCCPDGSCNTSQPCRLDEESLYRNGTLCGECDPGYYEWGIGCIPCPRFNVPLLIVPFLIGTLFSVYVYRSGAMLRADFGIMMYYLQTIPYIVGPNSVASPAFEAFVWKIDYLSLGGQCPLALSDSQKNLMQLIVPTIVCMQFGVVVAVGRFLVKFKWPETTAWKGGPNVKTTNNELFAAVNMLIMVYSAYTEMVFQLFICREVEGVLVSKISPTVECYSGLHSAVLFAPVLLALFLVLPIPVVAVVVRYRAMVVYEASLEKPESANVGHLWIDLKHSYYWWPAIMLFRRALIILSYIIWYENPEIKSLVVLLLCLVTGLAQFSAMPFLSSADNFFENLSLFFLSSSAYLEHYSSRYAFPPPAHTDMRLAFPYTGLVIVVAYWWYNIVRRVLIVYYPDWKILRDPTQILEDLLSDFVSFDSSLLESDSGERDEFGTGLVHSSSTKRLVDAGIDLDSHRSVKEGSAAKDKESAMAGKLDALTGHAVDTKAPDHTESAPSLDDGEEEEEESEG